MYRKTYLKINLKNITHNVQTILKKYNDYKYYIGIVKANCYNHDEVIIEKLINEGINYLAVSSLDEGISIRKKHENIPILCLEQIALDFIDEIIKNNITITISDVAYYNKLCEIPLKDKIKIHIKINTGMNRLGIADLVDFKQVVNDLLTKENIILEGIYSHLATADNNEKIYYQQKDKFIEMLKQIPVHKIPIIHLFNSSALLRFPKIDICNATRLGIIMYGINPVKDYVKCNLKPAISLHSEISQINRIEKGEFVGYGADYIANKDELIAIVPIGYADGFIRKNQGREIIINKKRYPIVGKICMDMLMVKVDKNCCVGDEVILFGGKISIEEVADYLDTIPWEVICQISNRVQKVFITE